MLSVNEESSFVFDLDFDEEFVDVALLDLHPRIKQTLRERTNLAGGLDFLLRQLFAVVDQLICTSGVDVSAMHGIGVVPLG